MSYTLIVITLIVLENGKVMEEYSSVSACLVSISLRKTKQNLMENIEYIKVHNVVVVVGIIWGNSFAGVSASFSYLPND